MSAVADINLIIQEVAEDLGIENSAPDFTVPERRAVASKLRQTIHRKSCERNCPHVQALNLLGTKM